MSLFPFIEDIEIENISTKYTTVPVEYEFDFETNKLTGRKVYGNEAIKAWVHKLLRTKRYKYLIYTWDYGNEIEDLISKHYDKAYIESEVYRDIREAVIINPYIKDISSFSVEFDKTRMTLNFQLITEFGEVNINVN